MKFWKRLIGDRAAQVPQGGCGRPCGSKKRLRLSGIESFEPRVLLSVSPIHVGGVYIEEDFGHDHLGDRFEIAFDGGAPGTQLRRVVINGDQNIEGFSVGDVFFDTIHSGLGADDSFAFEIGSLNGIDSVTANVTDGGTADPRF